MEDLVVGNGATGVLEHPPGMSVWRRLDLAAASRISLEALDAAAV